MFVHENPSPDPPARHVSRTLRTQDVPWLVNPSQGFEDCPDPRVKVSGGWREAGSGGRGGGGPGPQVRGSGGERALEYVKCVDPWGTKTKGVGGGEMSEVHVGSEGTPWLLSPVDHVSGSPRRVESGPVERVEGWTRVWRSGVEEVPGGLGGRRPTPVTGRESRVRSSPDGSSFWGGAETPSIPGRGPGRGRRG